LDPYLEDQGRWPDFHSRAITYCCDILNDQLSEPYVAQIDERIRRVEAPDAAMMQEIRETRLEILRPPDHSVVTVLELLSPANKVEPGFSDYRAKRAQLLGQPIHLVELDFLVAGQRLPTRDPLPAGHYYAFVSRADRRAYHDVYAWTARQPLPTIPVPLKAPDPDIPLDLADLFAIAYERGRYRRLIDYQAPLKLPLAPADRTWAEGLARAAEV
jgi:hypothetical protein